MSSSHTPRTIRPHRADRSPRARGFGRGPVRRCLGVLALLIVAAVVPAKTAEAQAASGAVAPDRVGTLLATLADDSLMGRRTATPGARSAARIIADELRSAGVRPAGDDGYFQTVPFRRNPSSGRLELAGDGRLSGNGRGGEEGVRGQNVVGMIPGTGADVAEEVVVVGAHYDHLGIGDPVDGDSIYNGADDDASGVVAVLEAARALAAGDPPRRTVVFLLSTGEELGLLGTAWYLRHPVAPLERTVANLQVEMIGRPDALVGGPGHLWLTGFHRSTMGEMLSSAGVPVEPDPRPGQRFFLRSDNIAFAREGIPAHTLSSYGMHDDYHTPDDEIGAVDPDHLGRAVAAVTASVRILADGQAPRWNPGGRPSSGDR